MIAYVWITTRTYYCLVRRKQYTKESYPIEHNEKTRRVPRRIATMPHPFVSAPRKLTRDEAFTEAIAQAYRYLLDLAEARRKENV